MGKGDRGKRPYPGVSVSTKLLFYFLIFMMLLLVVLFVFQVMLLNVFYRYTKINEMEHVFEMIEVSLENGKSELSKSVINHADEYRICVRVFAIEQGGLAEIADVNAAESCFLHHINSRTLDKLYQRALHEQGHYSTVRPMTTQAHEITEEQTSEDIVHSGKQIFTERMSMISVDICYAADGTPYVVMLNSELTPLRATVQTLRMQFIWISVIFVGLALLMAMVFARSIISPIVRMNQAAKQLATGNYDVQFEGEGYRETKELAATLNYASKELSKNDRQIIILRHFDDMDNAECARVLGIEPKAASIRYVRALERLQKKLVQYTEFQN
jgi:RNA polymerase sigma factor (sigma-70 family)